MAKVLIVDDEQDTLQLFQLAVSGSGHEVFTSSTPQEAAEIVSEKNPEIAFVDLRLRNSSGMDILHDIKKLYPETDVIMITGYQDMETAIKAMQFGAFDYVSKPLEFSHIHSLIDRAMEARRHRSSSFMQHSPWNWHGMKEIIGKSKPMEEIYKLIGLASQNKTTVLIQGETGTGKELVARAIHQYSQQKGKPFIAVNCSALTENILESELFGHEKGAFTGASQRHRGKFEIASGGTIFLDEVGDIPQGIQIKLLRVLQEREFERVGGEETIRVDVRVIAATNRNISKIIADGKFRQDLYYRLKVMTIEVPPLRGRFEDIPLLTDYFIGKANSELSKEVKGIAPDAMALFMKHDWKGNVRELENAVYRSVLMARGNVILREHIPELYFTHDPINITSEHHAAINDPSSGKGFTASSSHVIPLDDVEKDAIQRALSFTNWNKSRACQLLNIPRPKLDRKIKKYGLMPQKLNA